MAQGNDWKKWPLPEGVFGIMEMEIKLQNGQIASGDLHFERFYKNGREFFHVNGQQVELPLQWREVEDKEIVMNEHEKTSFEKACRHLSKAMRDLGEAFVGPFAHIVTTLEKSRAEMKRRGDLLATVREEISKAEPVLTNAALAKAARPYKQGKR